MPWRRADHTVAVRQRDDTVTDAVVGTGPDHAAHCTRGRDRPGANVTGLSAGHYATGVRVGAAAWATCFGWIGEGELVGGHEFALPAGIGPNTLNVPDLHLCH